MAKFDGGNWQSTSLNKTFKIVVKGHPVSKLTTVIGCGLAITGIVVTAVGSWFAGANDYHRAEMDAFDKMINEEKMTIK